MLFYSELSGYVWGVKHVYIVTQDARSYPCKSHNDTQVHVLGVHSNFGAAIVHVHSCAISRVARGMSVMWSNTYVYKRVRKFDETIEMSVYLSKDDKTETCEFAIHRYTVKK